MPRLPLSIREDGIMSETIMKIDHISKFYPGVTALNDVSFEIKKGEVHALCGENGAGKSTLIKCIMGVEKPDKGKVQMNYNGEWVVNSNALEAQSHGVFANYQHVNIAQDLSIAENYFLGRQPKTKLGLVDWKKMQDDTRKIIDKFEMNVNPNEKIKTLPIAMQAMVTISKMSVNDDIRVVIFDEPTALLENEKVEILFKFIAELKEKGVSIIYISHRLEEVMDICDTVTVLKDGTYVDTKPISAVTKDSLIAMMVGREMSDIYNIGHQKPGEEVLRVENFSDSSHFKDINFNLKKGEILGFVGLVGAGRTEVMRCIYGADPCDGGTVIFEGKPHKKKIADSIKKGFGFVPEDRRNQGFTPLLSIERNVALTNYDSLANGGMVHTGKEKKLGQDMVDRLNIKPNNPLIPVGNLSGGNQQKAVLAKWLSRDLKLLIIDEPTAGIDIGAKDEIYKILEELAANGTSVIMVSSDLQELLRVSQRIIVMRKGGIFTEFSNGRVTQEDILMAESGILVKEAEKHDEK